MVSIVIVWSFSPPETFDVEVWISRLAVGADGRPYGVADPSAFWVRDGKYYMNETAQDFGKIGTEQWKTDYKVFVFGLGARF